MDLLRPTVNVPAAAPLHASAGRRSPLAARRSLVAGRRSPVAGALECC